MSYLNDRQTGRLWAKIKALVASAISSITSISFEIVQTLPATGAAGAIYLVPNSGSSPNIYDEYIYVANAWEKIGTTEIDLSGYVQTSRKVNNKALSADITLTASDVGSQAKITASGLLKGDGSGNITAAVAGTDYIASHQDISGKLDKSGGTMTGYLTLHDDPVINYHAATKKYVDDAKSEILSMTKTIFRINVDGSNASLFLSDNTPATFDNVVMGNAWSFDVEFVQILPVSSNTHERLYELFYIDEANNGVVLISVESDKLHVVSVSGSPGLTGTYSVVDLQQQITASGILKGDGNGGVTAAVEGTDYLKTYTETDPTVPSWAKQSTKPSYTASEVGAVPTSRTVNGKALSSNITLSASDVSALPASTTIPSKTSDLTNDSGFITGYTETDPTVPSWAKASSKPSYTASEVGAVPTSRTVNGKALSANISLTASDVGALPSSTQIPDSTSDLTNDSGFLTLATLPIYDGTVV